MSDGQIFVLFWGISFVFLKCNSGGEDMHQSFYSTILYGTKEEIPEWTNQSGFGRNLTVTITNNTHISPSGVHAPAQLSGHYRRVTKICMG